MFTFLSNKLFGGLLEISPKNDIFWKTFNSEFQTIEVWFTDQNGQPLEIEDKYARDSYASQPLEIEDKYARDSYARDWQFKPSCSHCNLRSK